MPVGMTEQVAQTAERQRAASAAPGPYRWEARYYNATEGTPDASCYILAFRPGQLNRVVRSVCTPGEAADLVKAHNKEIDDAD